MMEGGPSKIPSPPQQSSFKPDPKAATAAQNPKPAVKTADGGLETQTPTGGVLETQTDRETPQHEINQNCANCWRGGSRGFAVYISFVNSAF